MLYVYVNVIGIGSSQLLLTHVLLHTLCAKGRFHYCTIIQPNVQLSLHHFRFGFALPGLAIEVHSRGRVEGSFVFWQVRGLKKGFLNKFLFAEKAADGLIKGEFWKFEEKRIVDRRPGFFIGLRMVRLETGSLVKGITYIKKELCLHSLFCFFF